MRAALKMALEALEAETDPSWDCNSYHPKIWSAITVIKEALAHPEPPPECETEAEQTAYAFGWFKALEQQRLAPAQEPIGYLCENAVGHKYFRWKKPSSVYKPIALYAKP